MNWVGSEDPILVVMEGDFAELFLRIEVSSLGINVGVTKGTW